MQIVLYVKPIEWNKTISVGVLLDKQTESAGELYFTAETGSNGSHVVFFQYYWRNNDD